MGIQQNNLSLEWFVILLTMALVDVAFEGISGGTELIAMLTRISVRLEVFRLHMIGKCGLVFSDKTTVTATPTSVILLHHPLLYCLFQLI